MIAVAVVINPGSRITAGGKGWTNTVEQARKEAQDWLGKMIEEGIADVELIPGETEHSGRWTFIFRHTVTGVQIKLEMHGVDDIQAYFKENLGYPRIYWNGDSSSNPELSDFAAPGYRMSFVKNV